MGKFFKRLGMTAGIAIAIATAPSAAFSQAPRPTPPVRAAEQQRPYNIIFVLVDDLRFDGMGFLQPGLHTPHIDFLAKNGVYFRNAVVNTSLCSPSRATILTGESPRNHGVIDNNSSSEKGLTFFPAYLQQAGYQTGFFGKWHMGEDNDQPRQGFNRWVSFKGQGNYFPTDDLSDKQIAAGVRHTLDVDGKTVPQKGYISDELTDYAMDWLQHGRDQSKPFFLYLSHKAVHMDPKPPERYKNQYATTTFGLPASIADTEENYRGKPRWVRDQRNSWHGIDYMFNSDLKMTDYLRQYYATLSGVDDSVGRILQYLHDAKLDKNTMVVFASDNGFQIGDHGLIDKRDAYEASVRVPLVMYAPGLLPKGVTNETRVRNLDFAPTFLDLAHVPAPPQFEGRSFLPVAEGKISGEQWKPDDFVYEYYWEWSFPQTPTTFAIVRNDVKYIQYHGIWDLEEVYDLKKDPQEMHNLADDPAYEGAKITLRRALFDHLANREGRHIVPYTRRFSEGVVRRNAKGAAAAPFPPQWVGTKNPPGTFVDPTPDRPADTSH